MNVQQQQTILDSLGYLPIESADNNHQSGLPWHSAQILGVVKPKTSDDIGAVLQDASAQNISIYPISCGHNWGYGANSPVLQNQVLLDLSELRSICDFDDKLGVVEIEPGVTQGQLAYFLRNTPWCLDCTGAGPDTSILGNVMERGFGHQRLGNRAQNFTVSEVFLSDGRKLCLSNSSHYIGRVGSHAALHELFTQNNLGVVSKIRIPLLPRHSDLLITIIRLDTEQDLPDYIEAMRILKAEGTVDTLPHIGNRYRCLGLRAQFNYQEADPNQGLSTTQTETLYAEHAFPRWLCVFPLRGHSTVLHAKAKRIKSMLRNIGAVTCLTHKQVQQCSDIATRIMPWVPIQSWKQKLEQVTLLAQACSFFLGEPDRTPLNGCFWRSRTPMPQHVYNPVAQGAGFYWLAPALPLISQEIDRFNQGSLHLFEQAGFEMAVTLTTVSEHCCQAIVSVYYDKNDTDQIERAKKLIESLRMFYLNNNWPAYRYAIDEMPFKHMNNPDASWLRHEIKNHFDPHNVIAPGRYQDQYFLDKN